MTSTPRTPPDLPASDTVTIDARGHQLADGPVDRQRLQHLTSTLGFSAAALSILLPGSRDCYYCGEHVTVDYDPGRDVIVAGSCCAAVDGVSTVFDLAVPSGKLVVDDDLRPVYDFDTHALPHNYNTAAGQREASLVMAAQGCAYGAVGNTCPDLYRTSYDTYVIASPDYDEHDEPAGIDGKLLTGIVTDLWAYSIADHDHWLARGGQFTEYGPVVVPVTPGVYRFTHHTGERSFDYDAPRPLVHADFHLIRRL